MRPRPWPRASHHSWQAPAFPGGAKRVRVPFSFQCPKCETSGQHQPHMGADRDKRTFSCSQRARSLASRPTGAFSSKPGSQNMSGLGGRQGYETCPQSHGNPCARQRPRAHSHPSPLSLQSIIASNRIAVLHRVLFGLQAKKVSNSDARYAPGMAARSERPRIKINLGISLRPYIDRSTYR